MVAMASENVRTKRGTSLATRPYESSVGQAHANAVRVVIELEMSENDDRGRPKMAVATRWLKVYRNDAPNDDRRNCKRKSSSSFWLLWTKFLYGVMGSGPEVSSLRAGVLSTILRMPFLEAGVADDPVARASAVRLDSIFCNGVVATGAVKMDSWRRGVEMRGKFSITGGEPGVEDGEGLR